MSAGIAKTFNQLYGGKQELLDQHVIIGQVAYLKRDKYIYYLVTKEKYWQQPTYEDLRLCFIDLFKLCHLHDIKELSIPKFGCDMDLIIIK